MVALRARKGGVLQRTGHTEAAVYLARLAGLHPVAHFGSRRVCRLTQVWHWGYAERQAVRVVTLQVLAAIVKVGVEARLTIARRFQRLAHSDGEPATAKAAAASGTIMALSTRATATGECGWSPSPRLGIDTVTPFAVEEDIRHH